MSVAFCLSPSEAAAHIVVQDDLDAFLRILPCDLRDSLLNEPKIPQLLEVILDLGRCPEARYLGEFERHYLRNTKVSMKELEHAQNAVGEFGGDNRAGIEGTLHRISAIRSRRGMIVGLTCRVGRAISGHVDMVHDLLQYGKSILFVGKPGVGKTTVMREIARVLADEFHKRVVGGVETVTLGDDEARSRHCQKTVLERQAPPTFHFLIEMRNRHYWVTHQTEKSVDILLRGKNPQVEVRKRDEKFEVVLEKSKAYDECDT